MNTIVLGLVGILFIMLIGFATAIWQMHRNHTPKRWEQYKRRGKNYWKPKTN